MNLARSVPGGTSSSSATCTIRTRRRGQLTMTGSSTPVISAPWTPADYLTITGRLKELIIRGGENIAPVEIEAVLAEHDSVEESAVVGLPDDRLGEIVAAVIRPRGDACADLRDQLVNHVRGRLTPFKFPARWFLTDAMPVTPTGKVRKFELRDAIVRGALREF